MAEILVKFDEPIAAPNGEIFFAQATGREVEGGLWEGWIEFIPVDDMREAVESGRETTQPNRVDLEYWAQGLTKVYLQGALVRAAWLAEPPRAFPVTELEPPQFTAPADRPNANSDSGTPRTQR